MALPSISLFPPRIWSKMISKTHGKFLDIFNNYFFCTCIVITKFYIDLSEFGVDAYI